MRKQITQIVLFLLLVSPLAGQDSVRLRLLDPSPDFHPARFWSIAGTGAAIYTGASIGLWHAWYKNYDLGPFHLFDDGKEWLQVDKAGHLFTAYNEARWVFDGARWTGMKRRSAMWTAFGVGLGLQATIEVMDGFSENWGFSLYDFGFNILGAGAFVTQELVWEEQRIIFKVSSTAPDYADELILSQDGLSVSSPLRRAESLYGTSFAETFLKDYNAQTNWASVNIASFLPENALPGFPKWLNLAVGYGANNLFGGFENNWEEEGHVFELSENSYPRYREFYLSFDVDLRRIPTRSRLLKSVFGVLNFIKIPAPTLEINTQGGVRGYGVYW